MNKPYKVSFKTYYNDRLKETSFHGQQTYPLYIQVTYSRKTIFFKSYYFELFSKPSYAKNIAGIKYAPLINDVIKMEEELIEAIIARHADDFSLELLKQEYDFYGADLCALFEEGFVLNMFVYFVAKDMNALGRVLAAGAKASLFYDVINDMKKIIPEKFYNELTSETFGKNQPYILVYEFAIRNNSRSTPSLTVMEWQDPKIQSAFVQFLNKNYPDKDPVRVIKLINDWIGKP